MSGKRRWEEDEWRFRGCTLCVLDLEEKKGGEFKIVLRISTSELNIVNLVAPSLSYAILDQPVLFLW